MGNDDIAATIKREVEDKNNTITLEGNYTGTSTVNMNRENCIDTHDYIKILTGDEIKYKQRCLIAYLNINSYRYKHTLLSQVFNEMLVDVLTIAETKLDSNYLSSEYAKPGYKMLRRDRTEGGRYGGGLIMYINDAISSIRKPEFECKNFDSIAVELNISKRRWLCISIYRSTSDSLPAFLAELECVLNCAFCKYDEVVIIGDYNADMLRDVTESRHINNLCNVYDLTNIIKKPTCFKDGESLIDLILTNKPRSFLAWNVINTGLSDCHRMIYGILPGQMCVRKKYYIKYRSYKSFDERIFLEDENFLHMYDCADLPDANIAFNKYISLMQNICDKHAPVKTKCIHKPQLPYMNTALRKAIAKKSMLQHMKSKSRDPLIKERYRKQRNLVVSLNKKSIQKYFHDKCITNGTNKPTFWKTISPFIKKNIHSNNSITLVENGHFIKNENEICNIFNKYFSNIGSSDVHLDNPIFSECTKRIQNKWKHANFSFHQVTTNDVMKKLRDIKAKKATGSDGIPANLIKISATKLVSSLTRMINKCIEESIFPTILKNANVNPCHKSKDEYAKENYRPISVLPIFAKIYESIINDQLKIHFDSIFSSLISAFRKKHSCQTILLKMVEDWKKAMDKGETTAIILIDLSKAFDSISHDLLLMKLKCYGLSDEALKLMESYLKNRKQRVKISGTYSKWENVHCGVPQGSILGPLLFNIFINDLFYVIDKCTLYNYADDNTISYSHTNVDDLNITLFTDAEKVIEWFNGNYMGINQGKFKCMSMGRQADKVVFRINGTDILPSESVKILGITIDQKLNFHEHISNICKSAARQLNVLKRLHKYLNLEARLGIYRCYLLSNFNYCPIIWHFCNIEQTKLMEKIQERALRFVYGDFISSYEVLLKKGNHQMLYLGRLKNIALEVYKLLNGLSPDYIAEMVSVKPNKYNLRNDKALTQPKCKTVKFGLNSFSYKGPKIWNCLPSDMRNAVSIDEFKNMLKTWTGPKCLCSMCTKMLHT